MCEFELRLPVARWLLSRGLSPIVEAGCLRNCDLVGIQVEEKPRTHISRVVAVELKLTDATGVLKQCVDLQQWGRKRVNEIWAAMPPVPAHKNCVRFACHGIGMLAVDGEEVTVVSGPAVTEGLVFKKMFRALLRRRDEHLWRMKNPMMLHRGGKIAEQLLPD